MKKRYIRAPILLGSPPKDSYIYHKIMKLVDILKEIKVNAPRPFVYDAYYHDEDHDDSTEGELYFNGELLDGDAVYSYGISDGDKIYYIAFYLDTPTYARLFDKLSPYIHNKIIGNSTKRTLAQITDYPDDYEHMLIIRDLNKVNLKNLPPFINEIKVVPPSPLRFEITDEREGLIRDEFFGNLYLYDELLDDMAFLSLNKSLVTGVSKEVYNRIKDKLPPHEILDVFKNNTMVEVLFDDTKNIRIVDRRDPLKEIKVLSPTPKFTNNEQLSLYLKEHPKFRGTLVDTIVKDIDSKPYPHLTDQQWLDIIQDWKTRPEGLQYKQYVDEITLYSELGVNLYLSLDPMDFQDGAIIFGTNTFNYEYTVV